MSKNTILTIIGVVLGIGVVGAGIWYSQKEWELKSMPDLAGMNPSTGTSTDQLVATSSLPDVATSSANYASDAYKKTHYK
ncbi:MAG: hypothetical protein HYS43_00350 [Candidatus Liptonbacteria bacterium]|nr:hypothetical protein [Candidatus Liptonbacteria bacterium]